MPFMTERKNPTTKEPSVEPVEVLGRGDIELSCSFEDGKFIYHYTPEEEAITETPTPAEAQTAEPLTENEKKKLERDTLSVINRYREQSNEARKKSDLPPLLPLTRIEDLDTASAMASDYLSEHPEIPVTHVIPATGILATDEELVGSTMGKIKVEITKEDLAEVGLKLEESARSLTRTRLASNLHGHKGNQNYAANGGVSEIIARGHNLTAEKVLAAFLASPAHAAAIQGSEYIHAGVIVTQGEDGITTITIVLGRGMNKTVNWEGTHRNPTLDPDEVTTTIYLPIVTGGGGRS